MVVFKILGHIVSGFLSFIYFCFLLLMLTLFIASNLMSGDYYTNILKNVKFDEIKLSDIGVEGYPEDATVEDVLVDALEEAGINNEDAKQIIESEEIREVAGDFIEETIEFYTQEGEVPQIEAEDIDKILNSDAIKGKVDVLPDDMTSKEMADELNKMLKEFFENQNFENMNDFDVNSNQANSMVQQEVVQSVR